MIYLTIFIDRKRGGYVSALFFFPAYTVLYIPGDITSLVFNGAHCLPWLILFGLVWIDIHQMLCIHKPVEFMHIAHIVLIKTQVYKK